MSAYSRLAYLDALRARLQREAGQYRHQAPTTRAELRTLALDTELFNEPEDLGDTEEIQGTGGGWAFMNDVSELDGDDPIQ